MGCLQAKDSLEGTDAKARVAAARIGNWLDHVVLPSQDILVDAPHLVSRYPGLLRNSSEVTGWDATATLDSVSPSIKIGLARECLFSEWKLWLSRPAWLWSMVRERALGSPWESIPRESAEVVFCEDSARFAPSDEAFPFICEFQTPFARRYVKRNGKGVNYTPLMRFADGSR